MRFTLATVALFAVSAVAQNVPSCALTCVSSGNAGSCSQTDTACLCKNQDFITSVTQCIDTTCPAGDVATAREVALQLCQAAGVTLSIPSSTTSASGSASGSATVSGASTTPTSPAASSSTSSAAAATQTSNAAMANGVNAMAGLAAFGLAALAL